VLRFLVVSIAVAVGVAPALPGHAETYRLTGPDGTLHFTNAPTDPRYHRLGIAPRPVARSAAASVRLAPAIATHIKEAAARHGVSERLVSAVIRVESGFNPRAVSPKGARGLMQLMPTTATILGVRDSFDPVENIEGGVRHLRGLMDRFGQNLPLALAAYNAGEQAVMQYRGIPPYPETQEYVARILRLVGEEVHDVRLPPATYRLVGDDGTTTYTNIPPRGRR
jgi:hypothetical protein